MNYSKNAELKQFGLDISDKFYSVKAKVLEPPVLNVGNGTVRPRNGQWQVSRLLQPESLQNWGLIALDCHHSLDYKQLLRMIKGVGTQLGMEVPEPKLVNGYASMINLDSILAVANQINIHLLFVVIPSKRKDGYHKVKKLAERDAGILTQCVKESTVRGISTTTVKNLMMKVNSKLKGVNHALDHPNMPECLKKGGVMIVGADVSHPSPDQPNLPSITAMTASLDAHCSLYHVELSIQTPRKEIILNFEEMMFDQLNTYKERNNNMLPKKIFVYRDGVSETQFTQVVNSELAAVYNAYQRIAGPSNNPEVLFLLVQKRHHTRLFNKGPNQHVNVEPGTVVDTDIVNSTQLDFYLVSHSAATGTVRPTRYHSICNDGKIPDDEVEQLTYYLCHLYSRCQEAVSYPTPTYYAHLACVRARSFTYGDIFDIKELEKKPMRLPGLEKLLEKSCMFFI